MRKKASTLYHLKMVLSNLKEQSGYDQETEQIQKLINFFEGEPNQ